MQAERAVRERATTIRRVLVGVDGSTNAARALEWAATLAQGLGAEVVAVHALGLLTHLESGAPVPAEGHAEEVGKRMDEEWCAPLRRSGVTWQSLILGGEPVGVLQRAAESEEADLVVVGRRGAGDRPGLFLGSTSHQLAESCTRPVVIVPASAH
jgi:nucleotide-binding universal stress UspA family protein